MSLHGPRRPNPGIPLKTPVEELRRRTEVISRLQGGPIYYPEELGFFRPYAEEAKLLLPAPPEQLNRPPDEERNEHQVWFEAKAETYLKPTWPNFFGMLVIHQIRLKGSLSQPKIEILTNCVFNYTISHV